MIAGGIKRLTTAFALMLASIVGVAAQSFPERPITLLVGIGPGSSIDIGARIYADAVSRIIGQKVIVENRPGGAGIVAAQALKQAQPDGYTLMIAFSAIFNTMPWVQKLPFDALNDFQPITELFRFPSYMTVPIGVQARTPKEFFEAARNRGGEMNFSSGGTNSSAHLIGLALAKQTGIPMQHVPYNNPSQYLMDLSQGRTDFQFMPYSTAKSQIEGGTLKFLAVAAPNRTKKFPEVMTLDESGYPGINLPTWYGLMTTKGTPEAVVMKLADAFGKAARDPELRARMEAEGTELKTSAPAEFDSFIREDNLRYRTILQQFNLISQ